MKQETTNGIICVIIMFMCLLVLSYIIPFPVNDMDCYEEIANRSCLEGYEVHYLDPMGTFLSPIDFTCCETRINKSRLISENSPDCKEYTFLEEDDLLCIKKYRYWKRVR